MKWRQRERPWERGGPPDTRSGVFPPDEEFVARLAEHDVVLVPFGQSVRDLVTSTRPDPPAVAAARSVAGHQGTEPAAG